MLLTAWKWIAAGEPYWELQLPIRFSSIHIDINARVGEPNRELRFPIRSSNVNINLSKMSVLENQIGSCGSLLGPPMLYKTQQTVRVHVFTKQKLGKSKCKPSDPGYICHVMLPIREPGRGRAPLWWCSVYCWKAYLYITCKAV